MRLAETPPAQLNLPGGSWVSHRRLPPAGDKVVLTGADGRFVLLAKRDFDLLVRRALPPSSQARRWLSERGVLHPSAASGGRNFPFDGPVRPLSRCVMFVSLGLPPSTDVMSMPTALRVLDHLLESAAESVRLTLHTASLVENAALIGLIVRYARTGAQAREKALTIDLHTSLKAGTVEACLPLLDAGVLFNVSYDGSAFSDDAGWNVTGATPNEDFSGGLRRLLARYQAGGVDSAQSYVCGVVTVSSRVLRAGASALLSACREDGLTYLELSPFSPDLDPEACCSESEFIAFERDVLRELLTPGLPGPPVVERRLALHFEAIALRATTSRRFSGETLVFGPDGLVYCRTFGPLLAVRGDCRSLIGTVEEDLRDLQERTYRVPEPSPDTCSVCAYEPYCGIQVVEAHLRSGGAESRQWSTAYCRRSMGTFDLLFEHLSSGDGDALRMLHRRWSEGQNRLMERLKAIAGR